MRRRRRRRRMALDDLQKMIAASSMFLHQPDAAVLMAVPYRQLALKMRRPQDGEEAE